MRKGKREKLDDFLLFASTLLLFCCFCWRFGFVSWFTIFLIYLFIFGWDNFFWLNRFDLLFFLFFSVVLTISCWFSCDTRLDSLNDRTIVIEVEENNSNEKKKICWKSWKKVTPADCRCSTCLQLRKTFCFGFGFSC